MSSIVVVLVPSVSMSYVHDCGPLRLPPPAWPPSVTEGAPGGGLFCVRNSRVLGRSYFIQPLYTVDLVLRSFHVRGLETREYSYTEYTQAARDARRRDPARAVRTTAANTRREQPGPGCVP